MSIIKLFLLMLSCLNNNLSKVELEKLLQSNNYIYEYRQNDNFEKYEKKYGGYATREQARNGLNIFNKITEINLKEFYFIHEYGDVNIKMFDDEEILDISFILNGETQETILKWIEEHFDKLEQNVYAKDDIMIRPGESRGRKIVTIYKVNNKYDFVARFRVER